MSINTFLPSDTYLALFDQTFPLDGSLSKHPLCLPLLSFIMGGQTEKKRLVRFFHSLKEEEEKKKKSVQLPEWGVLPSAYSDV